MKSLFEKIVVRKAHSALLPLQFPWYEVTGSIISIPQSITGLPQAFISLVPIHTLEWRGVLPKNTDLKP